MLLCRILSFLYPHQVLEVASVCKVLRSLARLAESYETLSLPSPLDNISLNNWFERFRLLRRLSIASRPTYYFPEMLECNKRLESLALPSWFPGIGVFAKPTKKSSAWLCGRIGT